MVSGSLSVGVSGKRCRVSGSLGLTEEPLVSGSLDLCHGRSLGGLGSLGLGLWTSGSVSRSATLGLWVSESLGSGSQGLWVSGEREVSGFWVPESLTSLWVSGYIVPGSPWVSFSLGGGLGSLGFWAPKEKSLVSGSLGFTEELSGL